MTDKQVADNVAAKIAQIRAKYLEQLPQELIALEKLAHSLQASKLDAETVHNLHQRLHKLTGSAGTFGLPSISQMSRPIEERLRDWKEQQLQSITVSKLQQLCEDIDALRSSLNQVKFQEALYLPENHHHSMNGKPQHIWLVDDDILLGKELTNQIESFGYNVTLFSCLKQVVTAIQQALPDLILIDVIFSEENKNSTQVLKLLPEFIAGNCPVIFMSAYDDFQSRVHAAQLGAEGFFLKPIDVPRLMGKMVDIFEKRYSAPPKILIVDDDESLAQHYRLILIAAGMQAQVLDQPENIISMVNTFNPELILMDLYMPDYSGPELAGVLRQFESWHSLPIVFLSSETNLDKQISAMQHGADDFLTKPISDSQLVSAVTVRIVRSRQLLAQITRDSLTGLLKHSAIKEHLDIEVKRSLRNKASMVVAMLDIDHFKAVNDTYGHAVGDVVICSVAAILRQRLRQYDVVGRYGGEEFVVVLPDCDLKSAYEILDELRIHFSKIKFRHHDAFFQCTLSGGLASTENHADMQGSELLIEADKACYLAKEQGRNLIRLAQDQDQDQDQDQE
jgi:diguanylate cyclase (GGDEF)-like protein